MRALRVIQTLSAGVDRLLPIVPAGVTLCDAAGTRNAAVAEWVVAAILASTKRLAELRDSQREHRWERQGSHELAGATVLILGYGAIGAATERRLAPFDVELIRVARRARAGVHAVEDLGGLLPLADVVVVLLPLTPETTGLLDADLLARLRPGALLVNAARGPILDTRALLRAAACRTHQSRAGRDRPRAAAARRSPVGRPGRADHPPPRRRHAAADRRAWALVGEQVRRYLRGEPLANVVKHGY